MNHFAGAGKMIAAAALLAGCASAQAPEGGLEAIDFDCRGSHITSVQILVAPSSVPRRWTLRISADVCRDTSI